AKDFVASSAAALVSDRAYKAGAALPSMANEDKSSKILQVIVIEGYLVLHVLRCETFNLGTSSQQGGQRPVGPAGW
ncbi:hypothetical protein, partial [uncultured Rhizobium sp.]